MTRNGPARARELIRECRENQTTFLDLGNLALEAWPPELWELTHLEALNVGVSHQWPEQEERQYSTNPFLPNSLQRLPPELAKLTTLKHLSLSNQLSIGDPPRHILQQLLNDERLGNKITAIVNIAGLANLQSLDLSWNQIQKLENLDSLPHLQSLDLTGNQIQKLENLEHLPHLQSLDLSWNRIQKLENLEHLPQLQSLDLTGNQIQKLENLEHLPHLQTLSLSRNQIQKLENLDGLAQLQSLNIVWNEIQKLENLEHLPQLQSLNLIWNQIQKLENLEHLPQLQTLSLSRNQIQKLENLDGLAQLQDLYLWGNQISKLENLDGLTQLQSLNLSSNQISKLENLDGLTQLQSLNLSSNQISKLENLDGLAQLQSLYLSSNQISKLENLDGLAQLQSLDLSNSQLGSAEFSTEQLDYFLEIQLSNNPLNNIPPEIANQDNCIIDLKNWVKDVEHASEPVYEAKLIVAGNGRVGKTCLLKRFFYNAYDPEESSTHGIQLYSESFPEKNKAGEEVSLLINAWDFGGQEVYHATHRLFMQSRALYLVVWDEETENTPQASEEIEGRTSYYDNHRLPYWLNKARTLSYNSPLLVIQTKIDKAGHSTKLPTDAPALEAKFGIKRFLSTSAADEWEAKLLKTYIFHELMAMPEMGIRMPSQWLSVKEKLLAMKKEKRTIHIDDYLALCRAEGLSDGSADTLLRYLHNTGVLFYQATMFDRQIILDQKWALEGIYLIFNRDWMQHTLRESKGITNLRALGGLWNNYEEEERRLFLSMMESCEICFQIDSEKDNPRYLIPEYLPGKPSQKTLDAWQEKAEEELVLKYHHLFFHGAFMVRFICQAGRLATDYSHIWKNGIWITHQNTEALITAFPDNNRIEVRVKGKDPQALLKLIHKTFKDIYQDAKDVSRWVGFGLGGLLDYASLKDHPEAEHWQTDTHQTVSTAPYKLFADILDPDEEKGPAKSLKDVAPPPKVVIGEGEKEVSKEQISLIRRKLVTLAATKLTAAIEQLQDLLSENSSYEDEVLMLMVRNQRVLQDDAFGTNDPGERKRELNDIIKSLNDLMKKLSPRDFSHDAIKKYLWEQGAE